MGNTFSFLFPEQLDTRLIDSAFQDVAYSYTCLLCMICAQIMDDFTDDLIRETSKFDAVKKELFHFLLEHKKFYKLKMITLKSKRKVLFSLNINYLRNSENIFELEDFVKLEEKRKASSGYAIHLEIENVQEEIVKTLKYKLEKSVVTNADIPQFLENHFLVDNENLGTECSNYKELEDLIDSRTKSYIVEIKDQINTFAVKHAFEIVISRYMMFLLVVNKTISDDTTDDVQRETRKFNAIKKELFRFLIQHNKFYIFKTINIVSVGENLFSLDISYLDSDNISLNTEDVAKLYEEMETAPSGSFLSLKIEHVQEEINKVLKYKLETSVFTKEDATQFLENQFLVDKGNLGTKHSNYKELAAYIQNRIKSWGGGIVSMEHINEMSFKFQGSMKDFEDEKSCGVCLKDYEEDQEVCRLPCNHFCCRNCTEGMFAIPEDGSNAYYQCPICRDDCT